MAKRIRIFVTTSHISTVYMTLQARTSRQEGDVDILFIDGGIRRRFLLDLIREVAGGYSWELFHSFSDAVDEKHDFVPGPLKLWIRKWKNFLVIKNIYNLFFLRYLRKKSRRNEEQIKKMLAPLGTIPLQQLFLMTQNYLGDPLLRLFPEAEVNYMEHGIGDYLYVQSHENGKKKFYAVFADSFRRFLEAKNIPAGYVRAIDGLEHFSGLAKELNKQHEHLLKVKDLDVPEKPIVFILLEAVDMYNVPEHFWMDYPRHIIAQFDRPGDYHYLLKTHPVQSNISITYTERFFRENGLAYTLLAGEKLSSVSAEVLFENWAAQIRHVFCLFSSGCFYLSKLYCSENIQYWYSLDFTDRYIGNAPPQFKRHFEGLRPIIKSVFTENCKSY